MGDFRLKAFQSVANNLSFTKASQELFISQPAITKHIQELETAYQTRLFDRQGSKISLTESGKLLLEHCERILEDYKRLEYEMHLLHNEYIGELKLGASTTIAQYVLPAMLGSFIGKFPQVNMSLMNGNSREIEVALQEHRIDLGLVEGIFRLPNLKYTTFLADELVAVIRTNSKLVVGEEITPEELLNLPLVLRERGSGTLDVFERALQRHNIKLSSLKVLMYLGSTESIKLFLEHTDCLGIVSVRSIKRELYSGQLRVIEIKEMPMQREFNFALPQGQESGLAQVFMQFAMHYNHTL
ncbi:LysR substrate-binding domain-containing protein [uncultured Bacteroides sp.]|uniref:LysR substrate-binding domain-containing protein n=1 Tax=uncultured Bacteroides sp. TaxID=162156 RepID=UPI00262D3C3C|nr:LysR substrate-binding domain-containing protein [uncultured Bacteroides sp.]